MHLRLFAANPTRKSNAAANSADATVRHNQRKQSYMETKLKSFFVITKVKMLLPQLLLLSLVVSAQKELELLRHDYQSDKQKFQIPAQIPATRL